MYLCAGLYFVFFIISKTIIDRLLKPNYGERLGSGDDLIILLVAIVLGICFIADSVVTSYLKTPLQRLAIKIENSPIEEKTKGELMRTTQETNELFKETFKKFGILVVPAILIGMIDNKKSGEEIVKNSERPIFYVCYLIPILFATWRIWQVNYELSRIEKKMMNERKNEAKN